MDITELLAFSVENNASDLHLIVRARPRLFALMVMYVSLNIPAFDANRR